MACPRDMCAGSPKSHRDPAIIAEQRSRLPIFEYREQFLNAVATHSVVVVVGETGSGKSTQMPQYLLESGLVNGRVAVTQPRRVAAVSVAHRVAHEMGCRLGERVGYAIRFEDATTRDTVVKYMTDGLLLMERDPLFSNYSCVIMDEAHERTLHTDVLLGLLKHALVKRSDLKLVITSATLDIRKFAEYFNAPMVRIPGKMFPVGIEYCPPSRQPYFLCERMENVEDIVRAGVHKVLDIHDHQSINGDILLFLPGKDEVDQACQMLCNKLPAHSAVVLPVYAALPFESQCQIFGAAPRGKRKVIVATNIAETSLTFDNLLFVVDTGLFKESVYDHDIETLRLAVISKAQADQRAGRAGRTAPGKCFRMYTREDFEDMDLVPAPAIHRIDFTATALQLKVMGINDICGFGFMDPPKKSSVRRALSRLADLDALDFEGKVTDLGKKMAEFPLSPNLAKVLLVAADMGCSQEVLTIVSMLSSNSGHIFIRSKKRQREADECKELFVDVKGDHITLLNVYADWQENGMSEEWARENYVNHRELVKAREIRRQLYGIMQLHGVPIKSCEGRNLGNVRQALSSGLPNNVAFKDPDAAGRGGYRTLIDHSPVYIHPSSVLAFRKHGPELVIFHETVTTSRTFMRIVSACEASWLLRPHASKFSR